MEDPCSGHKVPHRIETICMFICFSNNPVSFYVKYFLQTQNINAFNFGISIVAVQFWGLEGVAVGTLAAMAYQAVYMALYDTRVLLKRPYKALLSNVALDLVLIGLFVVIANTVHLPIEEIFRWILGLIRR